jgi:hypothetical protein
MQQPNRENMLIGAIGFYELIATQEAAVISKIVDGKDVLHRCIRG